MTVDGIMSRDLLTIGPDTTLTEIRTRLYEGGSHHLLVVDDSELLGVISGRDVLRALSPFIDTYSEEHRDIQTLSQAALKVMRTDPITVGPETETEEAARLVIEHDISSLPVVANAELVGIVTTEDLLHHYANGEGTEA